MAANSFRSIVVGTDLTRDADRVVRSAASIAALTGADLHVLHVVLVPAGPYAGWLAGSDPEEGGPVKRAERELEAQFRRATPPGFEGAKLSVVTGTTTSDTIRKHAEELAADLIVLGPNRGAPADRPYLGTTADRLIRTAGLPCLIIRDPLVFPIRRIGVLTDFSQAARAAQWTATDWLEAFSGGASPDGTRQGRPEISIAHIAWSREGVDRDALEARYRAELQKLIEQTTEGAAGPGEIEYRTELLWGGDAAEAVAEWVRARDLSMVVLGTQGISRLPYLYLGSLASTIARTAPCSVMLVPPVYKPALKTGAKLHTVVTGVDLHESSWDAALWAMRYLAPDAEHKLLHVIDVPDLPAPLSSLGGNREQARLAARDTARLRLDELSDLGVASSVETHIREGKPAQEILRLTEETDADLVIVGEQGPARGVAALLGSTAERVLFESRVPVLIARKVGDSPPRHLLAAVDPSEVVPDVLAWAGALLGRFDATITVLNVVNRVLLADELTGLPTARTLQRVEDEATTAIRRWLEGVVRKAGLPPSRVEAKVIVGDPSYEIISEAARDGATDLVLLGSKGGDIARTPLIGRIVNKVVRSAPCSVLVVPRRGST